VAPAPHRSPLGFSGTARRLFSLFLSSLLSAERGQTPARPAGACPTGGRTTHPRFSRAGRLDPELSARSRGDCATRCQPSRHRRRGNARPLLLRVYALFTQSVYVPVCSADSGHGSFGSHLKTARVARNLVELHYGKTRGAVGLWRGRTGSLPSAVPGFVLPGGSRLANNQK